MVDFESFDGIYQCDVFKKCVPSEIQEGKMFRATLFFALFFFTLPAIAQTKDRSQCTDGYALCMTGCTNDQTAERCMQSCQGAWGVFKMPGGFVLN